MTMALTEPSATLEPWGVETTATKNDDDYVLNGTKLFVPDAHVADLLLVVARTSSGSSTAQGITVFLVPQGSAGMSIEVLNSISSDKQCEVVLDGVTVPATSILGGLDQGWPVVQRAMVRAISGKCMEMLGGADAVLEMTLDYVKQRTQFGRPIGTLQAVQHHCAEMATDVEGCRNVARQAAWTVSEGLPSQREVSMAKAWSSQAYRRVCATAHQCHGAIGFTKEYNLQLYSRRAKGMELAYGDANFHKEAFLQDIAGR